MPELGKATYVVDIESHKYEDKMKSLRATTKKDAIENEKDLNKMAGDWDQLTVGVRRASEEEEKHIKTTQRVSKEHDSLGKRVTHLNQGFALLGKTLGLLKWPAMLAAGGAAIQGINVLIGGAVALTGALGPLTGALASGAAAYTALGQAALTIKLAGLKDISAALSGNAEAMKRLSPEAQKFTQTLKDMKPILDGMRSVVQKNLFPGLTDGLKSASTNAGVLDGVLKQTALSLAGVARNAGDMLGSKGFGKLFARVGSSNANLIGQLGNSFLHVAKSILQVVDAARPLTKWIGTITERGAKWLDTQTKIADGNGKLGKFFDSTRQAMTQWGHILRDLGVTLFNVFSAGAPLGHEIVDIFEEGAKHLREWTESTSGKNSMAEFFKSIRAPLFETGRLLRDIIGTVLEAGGGGKGPLFDLLHSLRVEVLPVLAELLGNTFKSLGPGLVKLITNVSKVLGDIAGANGPLTLFVNGLGTAAGWIHDLINIIPGGGGLVSSIATVGAAFSALGIASFTSKLFGMKAGWNAVKKAIEGTTGALAAESAASATAGGAGAAGGSAGGLRKAGRLGKSGFNKAGLAMGFGSVAATAAPEFITEGMGAGAAGAGAEGTAGGLGLAGGAATAGVFLAALVAIAGAIVAIKTNFLGLQGIIKGFFEPFRRAVVSIREDLDKISGGKFSEFLGIVARNLGPIVEWLFKMVGFITTLVVLFGPLGQAFQALTLALVAVALGFKLIEKAIGAVKGAAGDFLQFFKRFIGVWKGYLSDAAQFLWQKIGAPLWNRVSKPLGTFGNFFQNVFAKIKNIVGNVVDWIQTKFSGLGGTISNLANKAGNAIGGIATKIGNAFSDAWDKVSGFIDDVKSVVNDVFDKLGLGTPFDEGSSTGGTGGHAVAGGAKHNKPNKASKGTSGSGHRRQGGGPIPGYQTGDVVPVMAEPGEYVLNRNAVRGIGLHNVEAANRRFPRFSGGPIDSVGNAASSVGSSVSSGAKSLAGVAGKAVGGLAGHFLGKLPGVGGLPALVKPIGELIIKKVGSWIASKAGDLLGGSGAAGLNLTGVSGKHAVEMVMSAHPELQAGIAQIAAAVIANTGTRGISSTTGGTHAANSLHYSGRAVDMVGGDMNASGSWIAQHLTSMLTEGIHNSTLSVASGHHVPSSYWGASTWGDHVDHIHLGKQEGGLIGDYARAVIDTKAGKKAGLALYEAGAAESGLRDLGYGDSTSTGSLQLLSSTASSMGINPHDEYAVAKAFLTRGYYKYGSALKSASLGFGPAQIATRTQGNATGAGVYSAQFGAAKRAIASAGLKWNHKDKPMYVGSGDDSKTNTGVPGTAGAAPKSGAELKAVLAQNKAQFKKKNDAVKFLVAMGIKKKRAQYIVDQWWPNRNRVAPTNADSGGAEIGTDQTTQDQLAAAQAYNDLLQGQLLGAQQNLNVSQAQYPVFRDVLAPLGFGPFIPSQAEAADYVTPYVGMQASPYSYTPGGAGDTIMGHSLPKRHKKKAAQKPGITAHGIKKLKKHHDGGTVEGPWGQDVLTIAQGGERFVKPGRDGVGAGSGDIAVAVHGDLITERNLADAIEVRVNGVLRKSVSKQRRRAGR